MEDKSSNKYERLFGNDYHFIWSDNWWMEDRYVWFVAGAINILFCMDKENGNLIFAERIPSDGMVDLRLHPRCLKQGDSIFCLPDRGEDIWRYYWKDHVWQKVRLKNSKPKRIICSNAWTVGEKIYIVAIGLGQILELNVDANCIESYYDLVKSSEGAIAGSVMAGDDIYVVGRCPARIYKFNILNKKIRTYFLPEIQDDLEAICYDGEKFWLSGQKLKIYLWKEDESISSLEDFPEDFGIYNFSGKYIELLNYGDNKSGVPLFNAAVYADRYVWFIPFHANEILYIDKETLKIKKFFLEKEEQTEEDMKNQLLRHKYLLQYVKDNRYIGLFSLKNKWICEIDSHNLKYKVLNYTVGTDILHNIDKFIVMDYNQRSERSFEDKEHDLSSFLQYCLLEKSGEAVSVSNELQQLSIGQRIHFLDGNSEQK